MKLNLRYILTRGMWLFSLIFLITAISCKDEKKETGTLSLNIYQLQVPVDGLAIVRVSGVETFVTEFTTSGLVDTEISGTIIRITGVKTGSTTMTVKSVNGESKTCFIIVIPSQDETNFTSNETPRIEGWRSTTVYTESVSGSLFSRQKDVNALGETRSGNTTFEYAVLGDESTLFRASVSGDYTDLSELQDGLVVLKEDGQVQYLIANKVLVSRYDDNKVWLTFKFPDRKDIRLVTEEIN